MAGLPQRSPQTSQAAPLWPVISTDFIAPRDLSPAAAILSCALIPTSAAIPGQNGTASLPLKTRMPAFARASISPWLQFPNLRHLLFLGSLSALWDLVG